MMYKLKLAQVYRRTTRLFARGFELKWLTFMISKTVGVNS